MPNQPSNDHLKPRSLTIPSITEAIRDTLIVELGTVIHNIDTNKLNFCDVGQTAGATSWSVITSD